MSQETKLLFAGIPLRDMIAATSAGYLESTPLLDLNFLESTGAGPEVLIAKFAAYC